MSPRRIAVAALLGLTFAAPARAQPAEQEPPVAVMVAGDDGAAARIRSALDDAALPVTLRHAELPDAPAPAPSSPMSLADARDAYVIADFERCLQALPDDAAVHEALAAGRRLDAARILLWRVACHVGAGDREAARRQAERLATFGLPLPPDVGSVAPEVEALLADAIEAVGARDRSTLAAQAPSGAAVSLDGAEPACVTPCTLEVAPGDHVVALAADGSLPAWRLVRAGPAEVELELEPAPPEVAAAQWRARFEGDGSVDSAASMRLLARAVRARRLARIDADREGASFRLQGVLATDGAVAARAARRIPADALEAASVALLRELLVLGDVVEPAPSVLESPWLWIAVGVAAAGAAALTAGLLYDPGTDTRVSFGGGGM